MRTTVMEQIEFGGWPNCLRLANDQIELVATTDVGPRIIRLAFIGGRNLFKTFDATLGLSGGTEWRSYGGHRLWHAPETRPRLSLIHISEPTRLGMISYAVFCLKKKKT